MWRGRLAFRVAAGLPALALVVACQQVLGDFGMGSDMDSRFMEGGAGDANFADAALDGSLPASCTPGRSVACATTSGCAGAQLCNEEGTAYGPCVCGSEGGSTSADSGSGALDSGGALDATDAFEAGTSSDAGSCPAVPTGWSLVLLENEAGACPTGFAAHSQTGLPTFGAKACTCSCSPVSLAGCFEGTVEFAFDQSSARGDCSFSSFETNVNGTGCVALAQVLTIQPGTSVQVAPIVPGRASCNGAGPIADPTQVQAPGAVYCDVPAASAEAICSGGVVAGTTACIATSGQVACPAGSAFARAMTVSDGASLACSPCSTCTGSTQCVGPTVGVFGDNQCASPLTQLSANQVCTAIPGVEGPTLVSAIEYMVTEMDTCAPGSSTPSAVLTNPVTLCCR